MDGFIWLRGHIIFEIILSRSWRVRCESVPKEHEPAQMPAHPIGRHRNGWNVAIELMKHTGTDRQVLRYIQWKVKAKH